MEKPYVDTLSMLVGGIESSINKYLGVLRSDLQSLEHAQDHQDDLQLTRELALVDAIVQFPSHIRKVPGKTCSR